MQASGVVSVKQLDASIEKKKNEEAKKSSAGPTTATANVVVAPQPSPLTTPLRKSLTPTASSVTIEPASPLPPLPPSPTRSTLPTADKAKSLSPAKSALLIEPPSPLLATNVVATSPANSTGSIEYHSLVRRLSNKLTVKADEAPSRFSFEHLSSQNSVGTDDDDASVAEVMDSDDDVTRYESPLQRRRRILGPRTSSLSASRVSSLGSQAFMSAAQLHHSPASSTAADTLAQRQTHDAVSAAVRHLAQGDTSSSNCVWLLLQENRDSFPTFLCDAWKQGAPPLTRVDGSMVPRPTEDPLVVIAALALLRVLSTKRAVTFCDMLSREAYQRILAASVGGPFPDDVKTHFAVELPAGHCIIRTWQSSSDHFILQQFLLCGFDVHSGKSEPHEHHQAIVVIFSETLADGSPAPEDVYEALIHMALDPDFELKPIDCAVKHGADARALTRAVQVHSEEPVVAAAVDWFDRVEECLVNILVDLPADAFNNLPEHDRALVRNEREAADEVPPIVAL